MIEFEPRCNGCHALCGDMDTLKIHERFCEQNIKKLNLARSDKPRIPVKIKTCINIASSVCAACARYSKYRHKCLEGVWN